MFLIPALAQSQSWQPIANTMMDDRWAPSSCLLPGGADALIAGGYSFTRLRCVSSSDRYSSKTHLFQHCSGRLNIPRDFAPATLLPTGQVLICGGFNDVLGSLNTAELYDPQTDRFTVAPQTMASPRELHTATSLVDGRVLIVGGLNLWNHRTTSSAEIYDPQAQSFTTTTGAMSNDRFGHAACRIADGRVLIVGGTSVYFARQGGYANVLASAEIYDPKTDRFTKTRGDLHIARDRPTASLLPDGEVLIAGGQGAGGVSIAQAELFDPASGMFTEVPGPETARMAHSAVSLPSGQVLVMGGWCAPDHATTASDELFHLETRSFAELPPLPFASHDQASAVFSDGSVLVAGGKSVTATGSATGVNGGAWIKLEVQ